MKIKLQSRRIIPLKEVPSSFYDPERDGITYSLLSTFKTCREKARLVLNGWTSTGNSLGLTFGSLAHGILQHIYNDVRAGRLTEMPSAKYVTKKCREVEAIWKQENPLADADSLVNLEFSMILLEASMPYYFKYWIKDFKLDWERVEQEFKIPIELEHPIPGRPSMKTFLRGKIDGSFAAKESRRPVLLETKTRSRLGEHGESNLADILPHELQVNLYLLYLWWADKVLPEGVMYNIIRRPNFQRKRNESILKFARRVAADIQLRPEYYFIRLHMYVEKKDLERQELEIRDLAADFIMWWHGYAGHYKNSNACEDKYGTCGFLPVCSRGDYTGLFKRDRVFRELADEV